MNDVIPSNTDLDQLKDINDKLCKEILKLAMDTAQNDLNHYDGKEPISEVAKTRIVVEYLQAAILDEITMLSEWTTRMSDMPNGSQNDNEATSFVGQYSILCFLKLAVGLARGV